MKNPILAVIAVAVATLSLDASAATRYSAMTAPDAESRAVLAHPFVAVSQWKNSTAGLDAAVHASFPQIIEQNFARLDAAGAAALLHSLSDVELAHLSQLYTNAVTDAGHAAHLQNILASRLEAPDLARVSKYFGYAPMAAAVSVAAPQKSFAFEQIADTATVSPTPGARPLAVQPSRVGVNLVGSGQFLNDTPTQVYLSFRTAPAGSLGVSGALFEAGVVISQGACLACHGGTAASNVVRGLVQTYDPELEDAIGGPIDHMIVSYTTSWNQTLRGNWQESLGTDFILNNQQINIATLHGGDYGVTVEWEDVATGGAGSGSCGMDRECDLQ